MLVELPDAPFDGQRRRVLLAAPFSCESIDHVTSEQVVLAKARELEDALPGRENPALRVADDEPGARRRVVVVEELEEEAETAVSDSRPVGRSGLRGRSWSTERRRQFGQMKYGTRRW